MGSCLWTPAGNLLQINTTLFFLLKWSSKKAAARSRTRGNPALLKTWLVSLRRGRMAQNRETQSYCRNHTVFLALSDGFFHQKKKRMLWPSSSNLRFCVPSKELSAPGSLWNPREEKLICSTRAHGGKAWADRNVANCCKKNPGRRCTRCQFSTEFQPCC